MTRHVDAAAMAAYREGLLRRGRHARITAHLASCPACVGLDAQLADVSAALAAVPEAVLPASLAARLDAALAAEAALSARTGTSGAGAAAPLAGAASGEAGGSHAGTRTPAPHRRQWATRLAATAAAVVVLCGGGYAISQSLSTSPTQSTSAGSSAIQPAQPKAGPASGPERMGAQVMGGLSGRVIASGTDYLPATLARQVQAVLGAHNPAASGLSPAPSPPGARTLLAGLPGCLSRLAHGQQPSLVDLARYAGKPAAIVVLPAGQQQLVLVVSPACSARSGDVIARVTLPAQG